MAEEATEEKAEEKAPPGKKEGFFKKFEEGYKKHWQLYSAGIGVVGLILAYLIWQNSGGGSSTTASTLPSTNPVDTSSYGNPLDTGGLPTSGSGGSGGSSAAGGATGDASGVGGSYASGSGYDYSGGGSGSYDYSGSGSGQSLQDLFSGVYFPGRGNQPGVTPGTFTYTGSLGGPGGNPFPTTSVVGITSSPIGNPTQAPAISSPIRAVTASPISAPVSTAVFSPAPISSAPVASAVPKPQTFTGLHTFTG